MATIHGYIPQYKAYPERYDKYFKEKDGRSKVKVVGGEKITAKFRVLPPQDPVLREKYDKKLSSAEAARWSDLSQSHPLPEDPVHENYPQVLPDGAVRYFGFDYFPEHSPEEMPVIPPEEITPLFLVRKNKRCGVPWFQKQILEEIGFRMGENQKMAHTVVVKNVPEMNRKLYNIKHLVEILPLRIPKDLPLDADPRHCFINDNAELVYEPEQEAVYEKLDIPNPEDETAISIGELHREGRSKWEMPWNLKHH